MSVAKVMAPDRDEYWNDHPIIVECAVLPTRAVKDAVARTLQMARKARSSIAFWADPLTGKSFCIQAIRRAVEEEFPGSGVLMLESVEDTKQAEGRLLTSILKSIGFAHKVDRDLAEKRDQVKRALLALSGQARRIFIIIDEAQEMTNNEYAWLKAVINGLSTSGIKVSTILFGQRELQSRKTDLELHGRSDLSERFIRSLREFRGVRVEADWLAICEALDTYSEYPKGSGWSYAKSLFPQAYDSGFRFASVAPVIWEKIRALVPREMLKKGLTMEMMAAFLAELCLACRHLDDPSFEIPGTLIDKAVKVAMRG
ncbi:hypothetical protein CH75_08920 [Dyella jiangningensis]|nr:hypothetical protein CH75_08920 [Dyella jiangningensis]